MTDHDGGDSAEEGGEDVFRTKTGKVLTGEDIQKLADEAERGYAVEHFTVVEQRRLRENALFASWEAGFRAGLDAARNPDMPSALNPYQYHQKDVQK